MGAHPRGSFNMATFAERLFPIGHIHRFCWLGSNISLGATVQHRTGGLVSRVCQLALKAELRLWSIALSARSWERGGVCVLFRLCGH